MAATSLGDVPLPLNSRMLAGPLDVDRVPQAVRQDASRPRATTRRIRRPPCTGEIRLRRDCVEFIKAELSVPVFLNELVANLQLSRETMWRDEVMRASTTTGSRSPGARPQSVVARL